MGTLQRPGTPREAHRSGYLYDKQTVSITTVTAKVFFVIQMFLLIIDKFLKMLKLVLAKPMIIKIAKFSTRN